VTEPTEPQHLDADELGADPNRTRVSDLPKAPPARPRLRLLPPDDEIYSSGAWVFFPSGERHQVDQDDHV
jgi:hypothetical protein